MECSVCDSIKIALLPYFNSKKLVYSKKIPLGSCNIPYWEVAREIALEETERLKILIEDLEKIELVTERREQLNIEIEKTENVENPKIVIDMVKEKLELGIIIKVRIKEQEKI